MRYTYETTPEYAGAYTVSSYGGVAWHVLGWETEPVTEFYCQDCGRIQIEREHGGGYTLEPGSKDCDHENMFPNEEPIYERTGNLVCIMIGDDRHYTFEPEDLVEIAGQDYCGSCGQVGCPWSGATHGED